MFCSVDFCNTSNHTLYSSKCSWGVHELGCHHMRQECGANFIKTWHSGGAVQFIMVNAYIIIIMESINSYRIDIIVFQFQYAKINHYELLRCTSHKQLFSSHFNPHHLQNFVKDHRKPVQYMKSIMIVSRNLACCIEIEPFSCIDPAIVKTIEIEKPQCLLLKRNLTI